MKLLTLGNDLLRQKAQAVKIIGPEYIKIANDMIERLHEERGIGLAGPQIGLMERIFVVHLEDEEPKVFINPSIIETSLETDKYEEGCLSIPGVYHKVIRPVEVKVQAWNEKGRPFTILATDLFARVILHEYDHLEGVLFIDRIPEKKREKVLAKYEKDSLGRENALAV
ncbi:MAG: peptide deformylase [Treponema sp.]|nr:peptide deformylase [Treponema sp.]